MDKEDVVCTHSYNTENMIPRQKIKYLESIYHACSSYASLNQIPQGPIKGLRKPLIECQYLCENSNGCTLGTSKRKFSRSGFP